MQPWWDFSDTLKKWLHEYTHTHTYIHTYIYTHYMIILYIDKIYVCTVIFYTHPTHNFISNEWERMQVRRDSERWRGEERETEGWWLEGWWLESGLITCRQDAVGRTGSLTLPWHLDASVINGLPSNQKWRDSGPGALSEMIANDKGVGRAATHVTLLQSHHKCNPVEVSACERSIRIITH